MAEQLEKMTWAEVISRTANAAGQTNRVTQDVLKGFMEVIVECITEGKSLTLQKLFTLAPHHRAERKGRNPKNPSEIITIPEYNTVCMRVSKSFKELLNRVDAKTKPQRPAKDKR